MKKIEIKLYGYGGELTAGTLSDEQYEEFVDNEDIQSLDWYEIDDLFHAHGCSPSGSKIQVIDSDGKVIYDDDIYELEYDVYDYKECYFTSEDTNIMLCYHSEKGVFFDGVIELGDNEEFDFDNLTLLLNDVIVNDNDDEVGYEVISMVTYKGEEVDNLGEGTNGKSFDSHLFRRMND
jgi:hypothetical protein